MSMKSLVKKTFLIGMSMMTLAPQFATAALESQINYYLNREDTKDIPFMFVRGSNFYLHKNTLSALYEKRGFSAIWVDAKGRPNAMAAAVKDALKQGAILNGLNPDDYWDKMIESIYVSNTDGKFGPTFELAVSEAVIRYVTHLSTGRFDPMEIDTDIKLPKKKFTEYAELSQVISSVEGRPDVKALVAGLDKFAPVHTRYVDLKNLLAYFRDIQGKNGWSQISLSKKSLRLGDDDPAVPAIRIRLQSLGYSVPAATADSQRKYDSGLESLIRQVQGLNGLDADGIIGEQVLSFLNVTAADRAFQIEVNMEKLRWLPKNMEPRHVFVNLSTTEFQLFDGGREVMSFRTINGEGYRRTPVLRNMLSFVELNPTWTAPDSIVFKDKLHILRQGEAGVKYLEDQHMKLVKKSNGEVVDATASLLKGLSRSNFPYLLRQDPWRKNALGSIKFPLPNEWSIYLHHTSDPDLFKKDARHLSSGCVRLEDPFKFAEYILRDNVALKSNQQQLHWSADDLESLVPPRGSNDEVPKELWEKRIHLKTPVPVYLIYLTVARSQDGAVRFVNDIYGQDLRVAKTMKSVRHGNELF
ncbi:L,D-transpeptidase family protein [Bdellovibrio bacteriovorus]|uniref:Putative periplasmic protein YcbB n=1 Tax=Bdellovibrio bacteriovorus str. Tiberius TaxID=1069642 RepID=K7YVZ1_BDEBC|nr:L,D-transpeptidase family protein [Bdellovibrio bacteriovorus]AFY00860.1 putative periplasmic protein YcbB [Bdellovibrio bacteriovorus str. Tiberius]